MPKYLISFDKGWMQIPADEMAAVGEAAHAACQAAVDAGVFVFGGGIADDEPCDVVATDGSVTDGPFPETKEVIGGFIVVDVATRAEAHAWAARVADACRCSQEVRQIMDDPEVDNWLDAAAARRR